MNMEAIRTCVPLLLAGMLGALFATPGCQPDQPATEQPTPEPPKSSASQPDVKPLPPTVLPEQEGTLDPSVVSASTEFGLKLLSALCEDSPDKNVLISPLSVFTALAMTYNGAAGETAEAMARTLELTGISLEQVNETNAHLLRSLTTQDAVELHLANSLWEVSASFREDFLHTNEQFYAATVEQVTESTYVDAINAWVEEHTRGRIKEALSESIDELIKDVCLVNVAYFLGEWAEQFKEQYTQDAPFTLLDGRQKTVPLMFRGGGYGYLKTDELQAVRLPYDGGRFAMYIVLPAKVSGVASLARSMDAARWEALRERLSPQELALYVPRFQMRWDENLVEKLVEMGMGVACQDGADFTRMVQEPAKPWIGRVEHDTFIDVTEKGTEAAASTVVEMVEGIEEQQPEQMRVDHPFMCAIRDDETGVLLFAGIVVDPG